MSTAQVYQTEAREEIAEILNQMFRVWTDPYKAPEQKLSAGQEAINLIARTISDAAIAAGVATNADVVS